ncbi:MAG TPA: hypothetical protein VGR81_00710 [Candidatus Acidoferrales bacterium]|nr:hypothetical protein [Candidatus Acidoferrales bacterium]
MRSLRNTKPVLLSLFVLAFAAAILVPAHAGAAPSKAAAAFQKLKTLTGHWEGKDADGNAVKSSFQLIAGNTAVMETLDMPGMDEMVTLYSIDGDSISLMHYCPTGNQPHMRAHPAPGEVKSLVFAFEGAGNLPNLAVGHEQRLVMQFLGANHIIERWTWRKNGKDTLMVYDLTRK